MTGERLPWTAILALGLTQNIGYGTLYYSFSILAPDMALGFGLSTGWIFGTLSVALLAGGLAAPWLGRALDKFGAGRVMTAGSGIAGIALILCALAPSAIPFAAALIATEMAANLVQYGAAFALLVQIRPAVAARSITYLTLIAGFASTLFWPITTYLHRHLSWQDVYLVYAAANLMICVPTHLWLSRQLQTSRRSGARIDSAPHMPGSLSTPVRRTGFILMVSGFSLQSLVSSAILVHMVPLLSGLGLGALAVVAGSLFGPSQVASRLMNMLFGRDLPPFALAVISAALMTLSPAVLLLGAPSTTAAVMFACLFGFGNGLFSIVSGTLPLALFGSEGYGSLQGKALAARLIVSASAPFVMAVAMEWLGIFLSLAAAVGLGLLAIVLFVILGSIRRNGVS
jgi:MFS family permease